MPPDTDELLPPLERCCNCENPTGRAGRGEDSIYLDALDIGPFCQRCWDEIVAEVGADITDTDELEALREEAAWVRKKLELPVDTPAYRGPSGTVTLYGALHVVKAQSNGYERYITAFKCDDKQGEIARQSVEIDTLRSRVRVLEERRDDALNCLAYVPCKCPSGEASLYSGPCDACLARKALAGGGDE